MKLHLPFWCASASAYRRPSGAWVVKIQANTQGIGCGGRGNATIVIKPRALLQTEQNAICWALSTPTGRKVRRVAVGCHYLVQIKARYADDARSELFRELGRNLRAKYDGEHYLYESEEGQEEVRQLFGLSGIEAFSFPVGLVPKPQIP